MDTAESTFELVLEALDDEWSCGSPRHEGAPDHNGPAAYYQFAPCEHSSGLRCALFVQTRVAGLPFKCGQCGRISPWESYSWVPIESKESDEAA